jgi:hypothetical protein
LTLRSCFAMSVTGPTTVKSGSRSFPMLPDTISPVAIAKRVLNGVTERFEPMKYLLRDLSSFLMRSAAVHAFAA